MLGAVRFVRSRSAVRRHQRRAASDGRRLVAGEPTLILRGMLAKSRLLLEQDSWRREDLEVTRGWVEAELQRRGQLPPQGVCAFCLGRLVRGRCVNRVCQDTLKVRR